MSNCLGSCVNKTHEEIGQMLHACYDNKDPQLRPWQVEEIHQRWTRLGKMTKAGRL